MLDLALTCWHIECHDTRMRIGYGYNKAESDFASANVDRVYLDTKTTDRMERSEMLRRGLRGGETLVLLAKGDLAAGTDVRSVNRKLVELGVTVEVIEAPSDKPKRPRGRPAQFAPSARADKHIRALWYEPAFHKAAFVQKRAEERCGHPVTRLQLDNRYGPRDGSLPGGRKTKRAK